MSDLFGLGEWFFAYVGFPFIFFLVFYFSDYAEFCRESIVVPGSA